MPNGFGAEKSALFPVCRTGFRLWEGRPDGELFWPSADDRSAIYHKFWRCE